MTLPPVGPKLVRKGHPWAQEKLEFLRYYLGGAGYKGGGFMVATKQAVQRYYIDLFAGPGQSRMDDGRVIDGSPLIAAKAGPPQFTEMYWVESDQANAASLRAHRDDFPEHAIHIFQGDANQEVDAVLARLPRDYPAIAFLDPEGSELDWRTIEKLARHKRSYKIEQLILFPYNMGLIRFFPHDPSRMVHADKLDRVMPSPEGWRTVYARRSDVSPREFRQLVLSEYITGLKDLGYRHVPDPRLVCKPNRTPLYFMIFATDHPVGLRIMTDDFRTVQATPVQTTFLPYNEWY